MTWSSRTPSNIAVDEKLLNGIALIEYVTKNTEIFKFYRYLFVDDLPIDAKVSFTYYFF